MNERVKPSVAVVGCGKAGTALAKGLQAAGYPLAGLSDTAEAALAHAARWLKVENCSMVPAAITRSADIVFITTPDGAIAHTCAEIVRAGGFGPGAVVIHLSGALPSTVLSSATSLGAALGSMHPLQSFASKRASGVFQSITFSIEGEEPAVEVMKQMVDDLGGACFCIDAGKKILYHAAAAIACNYLATLESVAAEILEAVGMAPQEVFQALGPLIDETLRNVKTVGPAEALTGPIVRGDVETVRGHVQAIQENTPARLALYKLLGLHTVELAVTGGTLSEADADELRKVLT